ncbi:MAG TPA: 30S ribosomal protein THX [Flavipsychrobacter sp.]|nr:30S ribosomal protein THX [Flavipsychrobacter sp.]
MGKGDKRSKKGKIFMGSYGVSRPARPKKTDEKAEKKA